MLLTKTISILMSIFVLSGSFITICPADEKQAAEIHLISVECDNHHCGRNSASSECNSEDCEHALCYDQSLSDSYITSPSHQYTLPSAVITVAVMAFSYLEKPLLNPPMPIPQNHFLRSTILRI